MNCSCEEWEVNLNMINSCLAMSQIHGHRYKGLQFKYCPWCGKQLPELEKNIND